MTEPVSLPLERNRPGNPGRNYVPQFYDEVAIVDAADADRVLARRWTLHRARSGSYVKEVGYRGQFLHRFILDLPSRRDNGLVVDHKNHDPLDNRRENLRAVENVLNLANTGGNRTAIHSQYRGVTYDRPRRRWTAQIMVGGKQRHLGRFVTEQQAALAYNIAATKEWGEHAQLNEVDPDVVLPGRRTPTSKYRGVSWITRHQRFRASIRVQGKLHHLGEFVNEIDAAAAYNVAAVEAFGPHAQLNDIDPEITPPQRRAPSSRFRGVSRVRGQYQVSLRVNGQLHYLGQFADEKDAALAYNAAAISMLGDRVRPNVL